MGWGASVLQRIVDSQYSFVWHMLINDSTKKAPGSNTAGMIDSIRNTRWYPAGAKEADLRMVSSFLRPAGRFTLPKMQNPRLSSQAPMQDLERRHTPSAFSSDGILSDRVVVHLDLRSCRSPRGQGRSSYVGPAPILHWTRFLPE